MNDNGIGKIILIIIAVVIFIVSLPLIKNVVLDTECEACVESYSVLREDYILVVLTDDLGANETYVSYKPLSYFTAVTTKEQIITILNDISLLTVDIATIDISTTGIICYGILGNYISINIDNIVNEAQLVEAWNECLTVGNKQFNIHYDSVI